MKGKKGTAVILFLILFGIDAAVWHGVFTYRPVSSPIMHFLDVGQGDAEVLVLPSGLTILTDAGPDKKILNSLEKALPGKKRIDLAIITHPQLDHFNGYNFLIGRYSIGAFIINGRDDDSEVGEWPELLAKIKEAGIPLVTLGKGDAIRQQRLIISILSPGEEYLMSGELNDTGLVEYIDTGDWKALLTADIGKNIEGYLLEAGLPQVDMLKIGHHGSKYSSDPAFIAALHPKTAVVSAGARNRYGHPAPETLSAFTAAGIPVFRTDKSGTISIRKENGRFKVATER